MSEFVVTWLAPIALIAVLAVLLAGLWNMMRGGSANRSQLLMRWRVGLQFLALVVIMLGLYLVNR
ncbi:MAG: twin transmembrane helix small protein [Parvibaculum sp.]|nr:twin transmembrane helix small protein [Parvibaculum sp.]